jgi:Ca2+:H+ antiporter
VLATMSSGLHTDPDNGGRRGLLIISCGTAILLLGVYVAYLIFQLKTHASLFSPPSWEPREGQADESAQRVEEEEEIPRMSIVAAGAR